MTGSIVEAPYSPWRKSVLALSLVLNLFLATLVLGHLWRSHIRHAPLQPMVAHIVADARAELSTDDFAAFDAVIHRDGPQVAEEAQRVSAARGVLESRIEAEPFDPAATRQAYDAWHESADRFLDQFRDTLVDALAQVSPQGRRRLIAHTRAERHAAEGP
ncbi:MAG: periplasmic heavy metal sensor [Steroidobacteraceae bacterium]